MLTTVAICVAALAAGVLAVAAVLFVYGLLLAASRPDPVNDAYNSLPAGRPELAVDTRTGSHDQLPIRDDIRQVLIAYCDGMWHTPPTTHDREYPL